MDPVEEDVLSIQLTGIWIGQRVEYDDTTQTITWNLSLVPSGRYPSAFGASIDGPCTQILQGTCDATSKDVRIKETATILTPTIRNYSGTVTKKEDGFWIIGTWGNSAKNSEFPTLKQFAIRKEEDIPAVHVSGVWVGEAEPAPELKDFFVPVNPIRWSLSVILGDGTVFGSGYFDDSGDIPGKPLLFYSLKGTFDSKTKKIEITKIYEYSKITDGIQIFYQGTLETSEDGSFWLKGTWQHPTSGFFGTFTCRRQPPNLISPHICLCSICQQPIKPGETRWTCSVCLTPWCSCTNCQTMVDIPKHPHLLLPETAYALLTAKGRCCSELVLDAFKKFGPRPFIGTREKGEAEYQWLTYNDIYTTTLYMKYGLDASNCPIQSLIFIVADLSPAYIVALLGAVLHGSVVVPVHGALDEEALAHVLTKTRPKIVIVGSTYHKKVIAAMFHSGVWEEVSLVVEITTGSLSVGRTEREGLRGERERTEREGGCQTMDIADFFELGRKFKPLGEDLQVPYLPLSAPCAILYTSGSTGVPKGAIFTTALSLPSEGTSVVYPFVRLDYQKFDPSLVLSLLSTMQNGGSRALVSTLTTLPEDLRAARPTHLGATPAFWNSLYQEYITRIARYHCGTKETADLRSEEKISADLSIEEEISADLRASLGNRLVVASSGGAPISDKVIHFVQKQLEVDIVDLYGSRETGGIARDGRVYGGVEIKLLSVPELGYFSEQDPPRGEICVCSPRLIPGYYNDEEENQNNFFEIDGQRFYRTGDIGELIIQDHVRHLKVIDRKKFFFKLSQGEWVSPGKAELVLEGCPWVSQALLMGVPTWPFPVAIVVPSKKLEEFCPEPEKPENMEKCNKKIMQEIRFWCGHHHLRATEIPQAIFLEFDPWTEENKFLTPTLKKCRLHLNNHYRTTCDHLYATLSHTTTHSDQSGNLSPEFLEILHQVIPPGISIFPELTFMEIGGDSLAAAKFGNLLKERHVDVPVEALFHYSLGHVSELMEKKKHDGLAPPIVHSSIDWTAEWTLPQDLPPLLPRKERNNIFMTGATGFLGPVLLHQILLMYPPNTIIYCLIRSATPEAGLHRLTTAMQKATLWHPDHTHRLRIIPGDLGISKFGISAGIYSEIVNGISEIYHNGATVNMTMPYRCLKAANVEGTVQVIRLALESGACVHHVSTVAALPARTLSEEGFVTLTPIDMEQKEGYAQTKSVAERLLVEAHRRYGLDIKIFRPCAISGDVHTGFSNTTDLTCLVLAACVTLRCAPEGATMFLNWIPADFVAKIMVMAATTPAETTPATSGTTPATSGTTPATSGTPVPAAPVSSGSTPVPATKVLSGGATPVPVPPRVMHIVGDGGPALGEVLSEMRAVGFVLEPVDATEWKKRLSRLPPEHPAYPVRHLIQNSVFSGNRSYLPKPKTELWVKGVGLTWPEITPETIRKYVNFFIREGFFPKPEIKK